MKPYCTENLRDSPGTNGRGAGGRTSFPAGSVTAFVMSEVSGSLGSLVEVESATGVPGKTSRPTSSHARTREPGWVRALPQPAQCIESLSKFTSLSLRKSDARAPEEPGEGTMSSSQSPVKPLLAASERLQNVGVYTLAKVFQDRDEKIRQGVDVIDLGVGNPDRRPPDLAIETLKAALDDPKTQNHRYPSFNGLPEFRAGIAQWYRTRFGVAIDPAREAQPLVGSKEGIAKFLFAHLNPGDTLLLCTPCYPAYLGVASLVQSRMIEVPLLASRGFLPDLSAIPSDDARKAKVICVNFPNNPTGAVETPEFYQELL